MNAINKKRWGIGCGGFTAAALLWYAWHLALGPEGQHFDSADVRIHYTDEGQGVPMHRSGRNGGKTSSAALWQSPVMNCSPCRISRA